MTSVAIEAELVAAPKEELQQLHATMHDDVFSKEDLSNNSSNDNSNNGSTTTQDNIEDDSNTLVAEDYDPEDEATENVSVDEASLWDLISSLSFILLWFQRSTFGLFGLLKSIVLGHCLQLLFQNFFVSDSIDSGNNDHRESSSSGIRSHFTMLQEILLGNGSHYCGSKSSHHHHHQGHNHQAWPPPTLVALAVFTVVALVVHPDGMTWIVLNKIRDGMVTILNSSSTCWDIMIRDYGLWGTVSASASVALVLLIAIAMHKTFLPNCWSSSESKANASRRKHSSKKGKRRKGHHHAKHSSTSSGSGRGAVRIKGGSSSSTSSLLGASSFFRPRLPKVEEADGRENSSHGSIGETKQNQLSVSSTSQSSDVFEKLEPVPVTQTASPEIHTSMAACLENASVTTSPSALESVVSSDEVEVRGQLSIPPVCTVDTIAMSDDISACGSSVRSIPNPKPHSNIQVNNKVNASANTTNMGKPNSSRGGKNNSKTIRGNKHNKSSSKMNPKISAQTQSGNPSNPDYFAPAPSSNSTRFDPSAKKFLRQKQQTRGNKNRNGQNVRGGGRGKGGRHVKNQNIKSRTVSPMPATVNNSHLSVTSKSLPSTPSGNRVPMVHDTVSVISNGNRVPPASPYTQSLFSCENGASGWSMPTIPAMGQPRNTDLLVPNPTIESRHIQPSTPSYNQATDSGVWNSVSTSSRNSPSNFHSLTMTPVRPPPGLAPPPGFAGTAVSLSPMNQTDKFFTPIRSIAGEEKETVCGLLPLTPALGGRDPAPETPSSFSWSGLGEGVGKYSSVKANPFATNAENKDDAEHRIEAELQELGGRMIGSVLDF